MKRECLNCGEKEMVHTVRDVSYTYKRQNTVISKIKGWHCVNCGEVEFDAGEGVRFAEATSRIAHRGRAKCIFSLRTWQGQTTAIGHQFV